MNHWGSFNGAVERELQRIDHDEIDPQLVELVTHAPMKSRLRNEFVNRGYWQISDRLTERLHPAGTPDSDLSPNFFCFAHWASCFVGDRMTTRRGRLVGEYLEDGNVAVFQSMTRAYMAFEREIDLGESRAEALAAVDRLIPPAPRFNADTEPLVDVSLPRVSDTHLTRPSTGLPAGLVAAIDPEGTASDAVLLQRIRTEGFNAYREAITARNDVERSAAILRGTAWLVISEQSLLDPIINQASRSFVRTLRSPMRAAVTSPRQVRQLGMSNAKPASEEWWVRLLGKTLEWPVPDGVLNAPPLRFRPDGPPSLHKWLASTVDSTLPDEAPFRYFALPDLERYPLFWTSLRHRLPVIFHAMLASHSGPWFEQGKLRRHEPWPSFRIEADHWLEQAEVEEHQTIEADDWFEHVEIEERQAKPAESRTTRAADWQTAHRLFRNDRELIFAALFANALPSSYASPAGAALLDPENHNIKLPERTDIRMNHDALLRLRRTQEFVDVMLGSPEAPVDTPGLDDQNPAAEKARLLEMTAAVHDDVRAAVHRSLEQAGDAIPDSALFEDPLGYDQCIGAGVSFVVPVVRTLADHFAIAWTSSERDSWSRVWVEITVRQGLESVLSCDKVDDHLGWKQMLADGTKSFSYVDLEVAESVLRNKHCARTISGVRLADKLRRDFEEAVPPLLRPLIRIGLHTYGDAEINHLLMVPSSRLLPAARMATKNAPQLARYLNRRFISHVLRQLARATEEPPWDEVYPPGPTAGLGPI